MTNKTKNYEYEELELDADYQDGVISRSEYEDRKKELKRLYKTAKPNKRDIEDEY